MKSLTAAIINLTSNDPEKESQEMESRDACDISPTAPSEIDPFP